MPNKIKNLEEMKELLNEFRKENKRIVTTNGSFDILHYAHVNLLEKAKKEGNILIVLLNSDSSIKRIKGEKRPIIHEIERAQMLSSLESVDYIIIFNDETPLELLGQLKPNVHVKGGSFVPEKVKEEKDLIESFGGKHIIFEIEDGFSTTNIIEKIISLYS
ncbi:adenylyltransferase/cytidyltransferase family protein [Candidatus Pacearchaeota archaeon]|nr:adenylyltransferase/cytidyltransferase family protein [Candidatus Pacearchaeota archaeon]